MPALICPQGNLYKGKGLKVVFWSVTIHSKVNKI